MTSTNRRAELRRQWREDCERYGYIDWQDWKPKGTTRLKELLKKSK